MLFKELGIQPSILKALEEAHYVSPSPIQEKAIMPILNGNDILACAQTGTGKTAAFAVPTIQLLSKQPQSGWRKDIKSLILTPTRELAIQIQESFEAYGKHTNIRSGVIFGGVSQKPQEKLLQKGIDVLIATPGRLNDLIQQGLVDLSKIQIFTLDEADRMLDMGFIHDVKKIIQQLPVKKQTLLFSATIPMEITKMSRTLLNNPVNIAITPISSTVDTIQQFVYFVEKANKKFLLQHILQNKDIQSILVFTRTKHGANKVVKDLASVHISAQAIHGNKSQNARQLALNNFKQGNIRVLVATDIAARGIDIDELSHVINYELPNVPETYVNRIGRTGRAGLSGVALSFCDREERAYLADIEKLTRKRITSIHDHPYAMNMAAPRQETDTQAASRQSQPNQSRQANQTSQTRKPKQTTAQNNRSTSTGSARNQSPTNGSGRSSFNKQASASEERKYKEKSYNRSKKNTTQTKDSRTDDKKHSSSFSSSTTQPRKTRDDANTGRAGKSSSSRGYSKQRTNDAGKPMDTKQRRYPSHGSNASTSVRKKQATI